MQGRIQPFPPHHFEQSRLKSRENKKWLCCSSAPRLQTAPTDRGQRQVPSHRERAGPTGAGSATNRRTPEADFGAVASWTCVCVTGGTHYATTSPGTRLPLLCERAHSPAPCQSRPRRLLRAPMRDGDSPEAPTRQGRPPKGTSHLIRPPRLRRLTSRR